MNNVNNNENAYMQHIISSISDHISAMKEGEKTTCRGLFDPLIWDSFSHDDRRHFIGRDVSAVVAQGHVPLESVGINSANNNLYQKV